MPDAALEALKSLQRRGPDSQGIYSRPEITFGHTRLSIIDTSTAGSQPMTDPSGRYTIVFNGEFFNFKTHREELICRGVSLQSQSDTEVILHWYILEKEKCLERINGFFALAIHDAETDEVFLARDRMGVKPLLYSLENHRLVFASEMKALMAVGVPRTLDRESLFTYLQLNYIPGPYSIFKDVRKLSPGHYLQIRNHSGKKTVEVIKYYEPPSGQTGTALNYADASTRLRQLLEEAVEQRLISDVPLGAFLSGGLDSSIITGIASKKVNHLRTFSIGFRDEPMFDETAYAREVAAFQGTDHTVFSLTNQDLFGILFDVLEYTDEPFADSSALNVFLLSKMTRKEVTVSLSGDGADELFGGYNKHAAEYRIRHAGWKELLVRTGAPLWKNLPRSRNSRWGNKIRQLDRFAQGARLSAQDRYWRWASLNDESGVRKLLRPNYHPDAGYITRKENLTRFIRESDNMNDVFRNDLELVLTHDMLTKVDMMSMANSLEVRNPFLDYTVVDFAMTLPSIFKIDGKSRKKILRDSFRDVLPVGIQHRGKQGFEVPLLPWFRKELRSLITDDLMSRETIEEQGIFDYDSIRSLLTKLFSNDPGESAGQVWGLIVFQYWWKKYRPS